MLEKMGFKEQFVKWIRACISTPSFSVSINGQSSKQFGSTRGLRQGSHQCYLLSPLLTAPHLCTRLCRSGKENEWERMIVCHLFFADDVMLFSKENLHHVKNMEEVLLAFGKASGLQVNINKSKIIFSRNVPQSIKSASSFKEGSLPVKHLGVPLHSKRLLTSHFQPVIDKVKKKMGFLGLNTLSQAGRVELLKSVAFSTSVILLVSSP